MQVILYDETPIAVIDTSFRGMRDPGYRVAMNCQTFRTQHSHGMRCHDVTRPNLFPFDCRLSDTEIFLSLIMEKIVRKFRSFEEADDADYEYYRALSGDEKLQLLLDLIMPENPDAATVERSARVHPLTEHGQC